MKLYYYSNKTTFDTDLSNQVIQQGDLCFIQEPNPLIWTHNTFYVSSGSGSSGITDLGTVTYSSAELPAYLASAAFLEQNKTGIYKIQTNDEHKYLLTQSYDDTDTQDDPGHLVYQALTGFAIINGEYSSGTYFRQLRIDDTTHAAEENVTFNEFANDNLQADIAAIQNSIGAQGKVLNDKLVPATTSTDGLMSGNDKYKLLSTNSIIIKSLKHNKNLATAAIYSGSYTMTGVNDIYNDASLVVVSDVIDGDIPRNMYIGYYKDSQYLQYQRRINTSSTTVASLYHDLINAVIIVPPSVLSTGDLDYASGYCGTYIIDSSISTTINAYTKSAPGDNSNWGFFKLVRIGSLADGAQSGLMSASQFIKLEGLKNIVVENVLTSTSATNALSAAQGKVLNDKLSLATTTTDGLTSSVHNLSDVVATINDQLALATTISDGLMSSVDKQKMYEIYGNVKVSSILTTRPDSQSTSQVAMDSSEFYVYFDELLSPTFYLKVGGIYYDRWTVAEGTFVPSSSDIIANAVKFGIFITETKNMYCCADLLNGYFAKVVA